MYLISPGGKFMNHFLDLKNPLLKSFGSYKVEWVNGDFLPFLPSKANVKELLLAKFQLISDI